MERIIKLLNEMKDKEIISDYAIGDAVGAMAWTEVFYTKDVDVFIILPVRKRKGGLIILDEIYDFLKNKGYDKWEKNFIRVSDWLVDFLPAEQPLWKEAVENSTEVELLKGKTKAMVMRPEYLAALLVESNRPTDSIRIRMIFEQTNVERARMIGILEKHKLLTKFKQLKIENKS